MSLTRKQQRYLVLHRFGFGFAKIGRLLGVDPKNVKRTIHRADPTAKSSQHRDRDDEGQSPIAGDEGGG